METWQIFMDNADIWIHLHGGRMGLLVERRLPPRNILGGSFHRKPFESAALLVYCASSFVALLGVYTSQPLSATQIGISSDFSFNFVALANASELFGRWAAGCICDSIGLINVMAPFTVSAGIQHTPGPTPKRKNPWSQYGALRFRLGSPPPSGRETNTSVNAEEKMAPYHKAGKSLECCPSTLNSVLKRGERSSRMNGR
ncbi:hypothetical protein BKA70DRAFT_1434400 [Coprinopsis sp. MPI-PUGE-AT-0042]|nr:hypothetical protein BKA70DRAFT_1434400 [Coprinopsis sp. MPI-PUGE-AT-0042]